MGWARGRSGRQGDRRPDRPDAARLRDWRAVLVQSLRDLRDDNAPGLAAALAFYALLALFPLLLAAAALAAVVADDAWVVERLTDLLAQFVPRGEVEVEQIVAAAIADPDRVGILSTLVLLATGRRVLGALTTALNVVSDVDHREDTFRRRALVELALLVGLGGLCVATLLAGPLLRPFWSTVAAVPGPERLAGAALLTLVRALLLLATFALIYAVVPRGPRNPRAVLVGAAAATALVLLARAAFQVSLRWLWDNLSLIYGPLAVATLLLLWAWYVGLITLFGASLASHTKAMLLEGRTAEDTARRHGGRPGPDPAPRPDTAPVGRRDPVPVGRDGA